MSVVLRCVECDEVIRKYAKGEFYNPKHLPEDCKKTNNTFILEAS